MSLSEEDLALIHALQIWPRAPYAVVAEALGVSASAVTARWQRLRDEGLAWVTAYPRPQRGVDEMLRGYVDITSAPGALDQVIDGLARLPGVFTIDQTAGGRDLTVNVAANSFDGFAELLLDSISRLPGVLSTSAHMVARVHITGDDWRLDALNAAQRTALGAARRRAELDAEPELPRSIRTATLAPVVRALAQDGRATAAELAERLDRPASSVRRQLAALLRSGAIGLRCDVAHFHTRWPILVTWWCRVAGSELTEIVAALRADQHIRLCASLTGPANLIVIAWTAGSTDLLNLQDKLERLFRPRGEILDSAVTLRSHKRQGWLLHPDGRTTGEVIPVPI